MSEQTITYVGEPLARQFKDKIEANKKNIADEVERATSKEAALERAITAETERATEAEDILSERIAARVAEAPNDGKQYARQDGSWVEVNGVEEAPADDKQYARKNNAWVELNHDITVVSIDSSAWSGIKSYTLDASNAGGVVDFGTLPAGVTGLTIKIPSGMNSIRCKFTLPNSNAFTAIAMVDNNNAEMNIVNESKPTTFTDGDTIILKMVAGDVVYAVSKIPQYTLVDDDGYALVDDADNVIVGTDRLTTNESF